MRHRIAFDRLLATGMRPKAGYVFATAKDKTARSPPPKGEKWLRGLPRRGGERS
jgi:hypothetical protein